jgi:hypothetical protein
MCGIAGIKRFGENASPITITQVSELMLGIAKRGIDASGLAIMDSSLHHDDRIAIHKLPLPAATFLTRPETGEFLTKHLTPTVDTVLIHTRAATKGNPSEAANNHPLSVGKTAVIHNGIILNDDAIFRADKLPRSGQVDSDIFRAILDRDGFASKVFDEFSRLSGSGAIAAIHPDHPYTLLLARSGSPIQLAALPDQGLLFFASDRDSIHAALRPWQKPFGVWMQPLSVKALFAGMPDNLGYVFDASTLAYQQKMSIAYQYTPPKYKVHTQYREKQKRWKNPVAKQLAAGRPTVLEQIGGEEFLIEGAEFDCPTCGQKLKLTRALVGLSLSGITCSECHTTLEA